MAQLTTSEMRILLSQFHFDFCDFLSEKEENEANEFFKRLAACSDNLTASVQLSSGIFVDRQKLYNQQAFYDSLDLYIKLLTEFSKLRPLPF